MRPVAIPRIAQSETEMPPLPDIRSTHCFAPEPNAPRPTKGKRQRVWRRVASGNGEFFADELRIPASPKRIVLDWHYSKPLVNATRAFPLRRIGAFELMNRRNHSEFPSKLPMTFGPRHENVTELFASSMNLPARRGQIPCIPVGQTLRSSVPFPLGRVRLPHQLEDHRPANLSG